MQVMDIRLSRLCATLLIALILSWFLPTVYARLTSEERYSISGAYSAISREFILMEYGASSLTLRNEMAEELERKNGQLLLPFVFMGSARKWGAFPVTVDGKSFSYDAARRMTRRESLSPRAWNKSAIPLYRLVEASPEGAEMEWPQDVFRLTPNSLVFIRCADGSINKEKSDIFTRAISNIGFIWPVTALGFNENIPPAYRPFDMGFVLADVRGRLFRLQMMQGKPLCEDTGLTIPGNIRKILVSESEARDYYALIVTDNTVYLLFHDNTLLPLPLPQYAADKNSLSIRSDILNFSLTEQSLLRSHDSITHFLATDRQGIIVRSKDIALPEAMQKRILLIKDVSSFIFPLILRQYRPENAIIGFFPDWQKFSVRNMLFSLLGGLGFSFIFWIIRHKIQKKDSCLIEYLLTLCLGLPGLLGVLIAGPLKK